MEWVRPRRRERGAGSRTEVNVEHHQVEQVCLCGRYIGMVCRGPGLHSVKQSCGSGRVGRG